MMVHLPAVTIPTLRVQAVAKVPMRITSTETIRKPFIQNRMNGFIFYTSYVLSIAFNSLKVSISSISLFTTSLTETL